MSQWNQRVHRMGRGILVAAVVACLPLPLTWGGVVASDETDASLQVSTDGSASYVVDSELGIVATTTADTSVSSSSTDIQTSLDSAATKAATSGTTAETSGDLTVSGIPVDTGPLVGDINGDNAVDFKDFQILQRHYGETVTPNTNGDLNGDGVVNFSDFQILQAHYGEYLVPEPASLAIWGGLMLLALWYVVRRRVPCAGSDGEVRQDVVLQGIG